MLPNNPNPFLNQMQNFQQPMMNQANPFMMNPQAMQMGFQMQPQNFMVPYYNPYQTQPTQNNQQNQMQMQQPQMQMQFPSPMMMMPPFFPMVPQFYSMMQNMQNNINHNKKHQKKFNNQGATSSQQQNNQPKKRSEIDPNDPQHSKDEIMKWLEQRKKNFPSKANILKKELEKQEKIDAGEAIEPSLSKLEQKLRRKITILGKLDSRANRKRESEKKYLMATLLNPYKKVKGDFDKDEYRNRDTDFDFNDERIERRRKHPESNDHKDGKSSKAKEVEKTPQKTQEDILSEFHETIKKIERGINEGLPQKEIDDDAPVMQKCVTGSMVEDLEKKLDEKKEERTGDRDKKIAKHKTNYTRFKEGENETTQNPNEIIEKLKKKQQFDDGLLEEFLEDKPVSDYKYKTNTLMAKLVIDSIYVERNIILQALRYMVKENFFQDEEVKK